ncbi:MAG: cadherin-like domain-containing protein, partial [Deltaproteobacteria bacterium]|nr:cadherin-like domain-containing protein [Deltaproteobacteria bacterium]
NDTGTVSGTVTPVNDAPVISGTTTATIDEDTIYTFTVSDFNFTDVDAGDSLQEVRIDSLPTDGRLYINGVQVTATGATINATDIANGELTFVPDTHESGNDYATFDFSVSDGTNWSASATANINVTPVADAPTLSVTYDSGVPDDAAGYWIFDENSGTVTHNELDDTTGTLVGGPTWVSDGHTNSALSFDGVDDYVALEQPYTEQLGGSATLSAWIKTTADGTLIGGSDIGWNRASIIGNEHDGGVTDIQWGWLDNQGHINIGVGNNRGARSNDPINDGEWHHVVMTRDASTGETTMYVDGNFNDSVTTTNGAITVFDLQGFGVTTNSDPNNPNRYLQAELDDIRVFDRVLTAAEVAAINTYETYAADSFDSMVGNEGDALAFAIDADLIDTDGSETLTIEIRDVPLGATISDGTNTSAGPIVDVTSWDLSNLTFTSGSVNGDADYRIEVVATSTEALNGSTASTTQSIDIKILNSDSGAATTVTVGDGNASSWDAVNVYGFTLGEDFTVGGQLDIANLAANGTDATIGTALGVGGNNQLDFRRSGSQAESLVVEMGDLSDSATITLGGWGSNDRVEWQVFAADGTRVGSGVYTDTGAQFTIDSTDGITGHFQYIAFTAAEDGYNNNARFTIEEITYQPVPQITGTDSDDYIVGSDAAEVIDAGAGDDTIVFDENDAAIDGGSGIDTLLIHQGSLDFSALTDGTIQNIEKLDLNADGAQSISLNLDDVLDMTGSDHVLQVTGGEGDEITFDIHGTAGDWTDNGGGLFTHANGFDQVQIVSIDDPENHVQMFTDDGTPIESS